MAATRQTVQSNASTNVKTSIFEKISYGMGDVACNVVFPPPYKGKQNCSSALTMKKQPN